MGIKKLFGSLVGSPKKKEWVARTPRVQPQPFQVHFYLENDQGKIQIPILNISLTGCALAREAVPATMTVGQTFSGLITIGDCELAASCKIVRTTDEIIGCCFVPEIPNFTNHFLKHFKLEMTALQMTQIDPKLLKAPPEGSPFYFQGSDNCELFFTDLNGKISSFSVTVFGRFLAGGEDAPFRSGEMTKDSSSKVHGYKRADPVSWKQEMDAVLIDEIRRFLHHISTLNSEHRAKLLALMDRAAQSIEA